MHPDASNAPHPFGKLRAGSNPLTRMMQSKLAPAPVDSGLRRNDGCAWASEEPAFAGITMAFPAT